jgi:hypothetical protein
VPENRPRSAGQSFIDRLADLPRQTNLTANAALTLLVFGVISMGGFIFSHSISIDDEVLLSNHDYILRFAQGRFLIGVLDLLVPHRVTAFYPYLLLATCYLVSYTIILKIHGLTHTWKTHLAFLIFILFPTNWLTQEFSVNVAGFAVGLVVTCLAALQTQFRLRDLRLNLNGRMIGWGSLSPTVIGLLILAIGGFQSLVTLYLAMAFGQLLFQKAGGISREDLPSKPSLPSLPQCLIFIFSNAIAAVLLHTVILKLFLRISDTKIHQLDVYFRSPYFMLRTQPVQYILGNLEQMFRTYFTPGFFYGTSLSAFTLLLLGAIFLYARSAQNQSLTWKDSITLRRGWDAPLLALLLLGAPLALNAVSAPNRIPMRALMALPYVAWLASILWLTLAAQRRALVLRIGVALSSLLVLQSGIAISNFYAARAMNYRSDQLVASTIASAIIQSNNAVGKAVPVTQLASQGSLKRKLPYSTAWYSTASGSFFNWDDGNPGRIVAWLEAMGIHGLRAVEVKNTQILQPIFETMQPWPSPGSIQVNGNTVLVKLGDKP